MTLRIGPTRKKIDEAKRFAEDLHLVSELLPAIRRRSRALEFDLIAHAIGFDPEGIMDRAARCVRVACPPGG